MLPQVDRCRAANQWPVRPLVDQIKSNRGRRLANVFTCCSLSKKTLALSSGLAPRIILPKREKSSYKEINPLTVSYLRSPFSWPYF